jgi:hypothetical protein
MRADRPRPLTGVAGLTSPFLSATDYQDARILS